MVRTWNKTEKKTVTKWKREILYLPKEQISSQKTPLYQQVLIYCRSKRTSVYSLFNQLSLSISFLRKDIFQAQSLILLSVCPSNNEAFSFCLAVIVHKLQINKCKGKHFKEVVWLLIAVRWLTVAYRTSKCEIPIWIFIYLFVTKFNLGDYSATRFSQHST